MENDNSGTNLYLFLAGVFTLLFAAFQLSAIFWPPDFLKFFGGPASMQANQPLLYALVCIVVTAFIVLAGLYAWSGSGKFRRLPLLRTGLIGVTAVYLLRGFALFNDLKLIREHPELELGRFAAYSFIALCIGVLHLLGTIRLFTFRNSR